MFKYKREMLKKLPGLVRLLGLGKGSSVMSQWMRRAKQIEIRVPSLPHPVFVRGESSDMHVFEEVFIDECYQLELGEEPGFIVDAGANTGMSAVYFANRYPNAQIVAVEPDAGNLSMLALNCDPYANIQVIKSALWGKDGFLGIANPDNDGWGFVVEEVKQGTAGAFPAVTMNTILQQFNQPSIDLLKMDIEGAERFVYTGDELDWLSKTSTMLIELHDYEHEGCREPVMRASESAGLELRSEQNHVCLFTRS